MMEQLSIEKGPLTQHHHVHYMYILIMPKHILYVVKFIFIIQVSDAVFCPHVLCFADAVQNHQDVGTW